MPNSNLPSMAECVLCPQSIPVCPECPEGQVCLQLKQTCTTCATAICHPKIEESVLQAFGVAVKTVTVTQPPANCLPTSVPEGVPVPDGVPPLPENAPAGVPVPEGVPTTPETVQTEVNKLIPGNLPTL